MYLWDEIRPIWGRFSTESEGESFRFDVMKVGVWVVLIARRRVLKIDKEINLFTASDRRMSFGEFTFEGVEGDWTFRVVIFESFGFREAKRDLGRRVIGYVILDLLVGNQGYFAHLNFIRK